MLRDLILHGKMVIGRIKYANYFGCAARILRRREYGD
jgi:hypothetical protein